MLYSNNGRDCHEYTIRISFDFEKENEIPRYFFL